MSLPPNPIPEELSGIVPATEVPFDAPVQVLVPPPEERFPAWSGGEVLAIAVVTVFCVLLFMGIALFAFFTGHRNLSLTELTGNAQVIRNVLGAQAAAYLVVLMCIYVLVRSRARTSFTEGLQWNWPGWTALWFVFGGIGLALAIDGFSRYLPIPKSLPMDDLFTNRTNVYLLAAFGTTMAPLLEELFFRGLLYPVLRRRMGLTVAVLLTALGFAAIHSFQLGYAWAPLLSIFIVGVVFTVIRERKKSVAASFLMHCGYNFTLFSMLWFATDHFRHLDKVAG
jgi:membrane protease YdiL (CAAX protease family)